jgi:hypothetical protein
VLGQVSQFGPAGYNLRHLQIWRSGGHSRKHSPRKRARSEAGSNEPPLPQADGPTAAAMPTVARFHLGRLG